MQESGSGEKNTKQQDNNGEEINPFNEAEKEEYDSLLFKWKEVQRDSLIVHGGQTVKYSPSNSEKPKQSEIDDPEYVMEKYSWEISYYLKSKYLLDELIEEVVEKKLLDLSELHNIEFMYCVCFRAWCDSHIAQRAFFKNVHDQRGKDNAEQKTTNPEDNWYPFVKENKTLRYLVEPM